MQPDIRRHLPSLSGGVLAVAVVMASCVDLSVFNPRTFSGRLLLAEAVIVVVAAWLVRRGLPRHPGRAAVLCVAVATVSTVVTVSTADTVLQRSPGVTAALGLAVVVLAGCRYLPLRWLVVVVPAAAALFAVPARMPPQLVQDLPGDGIVPAAVVVCGAVAAGLLWRAGDVARGAAEEAAVREERLRLAHDLHDEVAHHVTGIVIAAEAGAQVAVSDPEGARALFGRIEAAGQDGLTSMSRIVRLLRTPGHVMSTVAPTMDDVRALVERFAATDLPATLRVGPEVRPQGRPGAQWNVVARVVREGLTNVRKHARGAVSVQVAIDLRGTELVVSVHDDGQRARRRRFPVSGAGLAGLSEQLAVVGGRLDHGPSDGGGWTLTARIPAEPEESR